jgi:hypothetical protein
VRRVSDGEVEFETDRFILQSAVESRSYRHPIVRRLPTPSVRV